MAKVKTKRGRPTTYSDKIAKEICDTIASSSKGTKKLCTENSHWPCQDTLFTWLKNNSEFSEQYARAKRCQAELLVDEILEIADDDTSDTIVTAKGNVVGLQQVINRARLKIDTRKWLTSKLLPRVYGKNNQLVEDDLQKQKDEEMLKRMLERSAELEKKYRRDY